MVGPILDLTGAAYTAAVVGDITLSKNGTPAAMAAAAALTHDSNGVYILAMTTGNTDTLGQADIYCNKSGYAMPPKSFKVLPPSTYDALVTNASNASGGLCDIQRINGVSASSVTAIAANLGTAQPVNQTGTDGSAVVNANLTQILGTLLTETAGQLAAGFKQFFNVASPTSTMNTITAVTTTATATNLTNAPGTGDFTAAMKTSLNAATPASVGSVTTGVTVTTNNDKTGYALSQAFPANFASLGISVGGKINGVALTDTVTTYTGDTPQSGDAYARMGAAGSGLTAIGDTRIANLDATVSSRSTLAAGAAMTLTTAYDAAKTAATQASVSAIPTNPLTSLGSTAPTGWITALAIAAGALNGKGDWNATAPDNTTISSIYSAITNGTYGLSMLARRADLPVNLSTLSLGNGQTVGTGTSTLDASGVRTAVGLASANLDSQLTGLPAGVWASGSRTLSSFGTLVSDVWGNATRTITDKTGFSLATAPPTAVDIATAVWAASTRTLSAAGVQAIWDALTSALTTTGSIGKLLSDMLTAIKAKTDNLPADPASQATTATAITNATSPLATATTVSAIKAVTDKLATMLVAISTAWQFTTQALANGPSGSGLDAAGVRNAIGLGTANMDTQLAGIHDKTVNLPSDPADESLIEAAITAATSTLATATALAAVNTSLAAAKGTTFDPATDSLEALRNRGDSAWLTGSAPTVQQITDGVLDASLADHTRAGSVAEGISTSSSAGDPWAKTQTELLAYAPGTAAHDVARLGIVPGFGAVVVTPDPSASDTQRVVFLDCESGGVPLKGARVTFTLSDYPASAGDWVLGAEPVAAVSDESGHLQAALDRTDQMAQTGRQWVMDSQELGINNVAFALPSGSPLNLKTLI